MKFSPCLSQCTKEGTHCEGCGRNHQEIAEMKQLVIQAVAFANKMEYENPKDFAKAFANSIKKKIAKQSLDSSTD